MKADSGDGVKKGGFDDADVIHVEGDVDPVRDMEVIQTELRLDHSLSPIFLLDC